MEDFGVQIVSSLLQCILFAHDSYAPHFSMYLIYSWQSCPFSWMKSTSWWVIAPLPSTYLSCLQWIRARLIFLLMQIHSVGIVTIIENGSSMQNTHPGYCDHFWEWLFDENTQRGYCDHFWEWLSRNQIYFAFSRLHSLHFNKNEIRSKNVTKLILYNNVLDPFIDVGAVLDGARVVVGSIALNNTWSIICIIPLFAKMFAWITLACTSSHSK